MKNQLVEFYNKRTKLYDNKISSGSLYDFVYNLIGNNETILEVGSANGNFSRKLKKKNANVIGIEISPVMAKKSAKILDKIIVGNIETIDLPFRKSTFDTILIMDVLEHLFDPEQVLIKLVPYLNKDGKIVVSLPNIANWYVRLNLLRGKFDTKSTTILEEGHIRFYTYDTAINMFKNAGLKLENYNIVVNWPILILKIHNRLPFLHIDKILSNLYPKLFAFQFIFNLKKK